MGGHGAVKASNPIKGYVAMTIPQRATAPLMGGHDAVNTLCSHIGDTLTITRKRKPASSLLSLETSEATYR